MWALDSETSKKMSENLRFREPHCHSAPHILGTAANICINLIFLETSIIELHFAMDSFCLASIEFLLQAPKDYFISARVTFQPFKVVDFGANQKRVYDFLLVHHSNLGPILHRFGDIAGFLCS